MYKMRGRIRYSEIDRQANLTIPALINYFQDCCTFQAEDLGVGLSYLKENNLGWFVTSWWIHIEKLPQMGDEVLVKTWPHDFKGCLGYRNFVIEDMQGNRLVEAESLWVLMNIKDGDPARLPKEMKDAYLLSPALDRDWGGRKHKADMDAPEVYRFEVQGLHIDTNGHMNNEKYVAAAQELMPGDLIPVDLYVEYKKSALKGETVICRRSEIDGGVQISLCDEENNIYALVEYKR